MAQALQQLHVDKCFCLRVFVALDCVEEIVWTAEFKSSVFYALVAWLLDCIFDLSQTAELPKGPSECWWTSHAATLNWVVLFSLLPFCCGVDAGKASSMVEVVPEGCIASVKKCHPGLRCSHVRSETLHYELGRNGKNTDVESVFQTTVKYTLWFHPSVLFHPSVWSVIFGRQRFVSPSLETPHLRLEGVFVLTCLLFAWKPKDCSNSSCPFTVHFEVE